jgi:hypothetical protein
MPHYTGETRTVQVSEARAGTGHDATGAQPWPYPVVILQVLPYSLLCVTRTRVPYIASTTLVHRYIVS